MASFQTALQRQVWESVEIDSTTNSIGLHACLNHKTEWGSSKDPVLVPRRSRPASSKDPVLVSRKNPLSKGLPRAQQERQVAGNTRKRLAAIPEPNKTSKRRREDPGTATGPGPGTTGGSRTQQGPDQDVETTRSRWDRWQSHLSNTGSPEDTRAKRRRRDNTTRKPTECGLEGLSITALRDQKVLRHPHQGREGPGVGEWSAGSLRNKDKEGQPSQEEKVRVLSSVGHHHPGQSQDDLRPGGANTEPNT